MDDSKLQEILDEFIKHPYIEKDGKREYLNDPTGTAIIEEKLLLGLLKGIKRDDWDIITSKRFLGELYSGNSAVLILLTRMAYLLTLQTNFIAEIRDLIKNGIKDNKRK